MLKVELEERTNSFFNPLVCNSLEEVSQALRVHDVDIIMLALLLRHKLLGHGLDLLPMLLFVFEVPPVVQNHVRHVVLYVLFSLLVDILCGHLHKYRVTDAQNVALGQFVQDRTRTPILSHELVKKQFPEALVEAVNSEGWRFEKELEQVLESHFIGRVKVQSQAIIVRLN